LPLFLAVAASVWLLLSRTTFGRTLYALGVNETAARFAGLHVDRIKLAAYALSGLLSAAAAVIFISRVSSAKANAGEGYELDAITIVVLGGGSVAGGRGGVIGTLLGLAIIGITRNGLTQAYIPPEVQSILIGAVLVAAVIGNELFAVGGNRDALHPDPRPRPLRVKRELREEPNYEESNNFDFSRPLRRI
jgi:rhamnose transport system permease protein